MAKESSIGLCDKKALDVQHLSLWHGSKQAPIPWEARRPLGAPYLGNNKLYPVPILCYFRCLFETGSNPTLYLSNRNAIFEYDERKLRYRKLKSSTYVIEGNNPEYRGLYSDKTRSGHPIFAVCTNCVLVTAQFMSWRILHPEWSILNPIRSLYELHRALYHQLLRDGCDSEGKKGLNWSHSSFTGGKAVIPRYLKGQIMALPERQVSRFKFLSFTLIRHQWLLADTTHSIHRLSASFDNLLP